ncbi:hypothetical protein J6590_033547 [Homalodisca vitripennis]|nr:hypothetical protein J6590_033547 [Homalodisca vitripennis]
MERKLFASNGLERTWDAPSAAKIINMASSETGSEILGFVRQQQQTVAHVRASVNKWLGWLAGSGWQWLAVAGRAYRTERCGGVATEVAVVSCRGSRCEV